MAHVPIHSIHALYLLALAEGEGVGTAYEYSAKQVAMQPWLAGIEHSRRVLIAGLPQKYGCSLDFFLLAQDLGVRELVVCDDRPAALEKARASLNAAQGAGVLNRQPVAFVLVRDLGCIEEAAGTFDLAVSSEVVQRLNGDAPRMLAHLRQRATHLAIFAPNGDNPVHDGREGRLSGLRLEQLAALSGHPARSGFVDSPPFPPGLARDERQREQAKHGALEQVAMRVLDGYARLERRFPTAFLRSRAHIVYALSAGPGR